MLLFADVSLTKAKVLSRVSTKFFEDLALSADTLVSVSTNKAYVYRFATKEGKVDLSMDQESYDDEARNLKIETKDSIIAIGLSQDGRSLLCNVSMTKPRIELWDLNSGLCAKKYRGHQQKDYVLRPVFGGANERLVLCGSEDSQVYIWCRETTELLVKVSGHF